MYPESDEAEEIEAYCVNCKQKVTMIKPAPVWTRRGAPGTRGECEICGTTVFRMGRTEAHLSLQKPEAGHMMGALRQVRRGKDGRAKSRVSFAAYLNYSSADRDFARRLAEDLSKSGIPTWFDDNVEAHDSRWASGVHPGLLECSHMVVVLSNAALATETVVQGWAFFRQNRKPMVVAQLEPCEVPDDLRRNPRFDFMHDYKAAFRALVQALAS